MVLKFVFSRGGGGGLCDPTRLTPPVIVLTRDVGHFTCFIGHHSFYTG